MSTAPDAGVQLVSSAESQKLERARAALKAAAENRSNASVGERLTREAASRPEGALKADRVFGAFEKEGVVLTRRRQVLASTIGASYCEFGVTDDGLTLSVCEFEADRDAQTGIERSKEMFESIKNRTLIQNGQTVLTVVSPVEPSPSAQRVTRLFQALEPAPKAL